MGPQGKFREIKPVACNFFILPEMEVFFLVPTVVAYHDVTNMTS
jgi:hypothetical protein